MPTLPTTPPDSAVHALLVRLTRKGARLIREAEHYVIRVPGNRVINAKDPLVAPETVRAAELAGWIAPHIHDVFRLTEAGAVALRRGPAMPPGAQPTAQHQAMARFGTRTGALSPLARLRQKRDAKGAPVLSSIQVEAGERLARDFNTGQMTPRITSDWERAKLGFAADRTARGAGAHHIHDSTAAAQERVRRALDDAGAEFAGLLIDVCCLEIGIEAIERQRHWPPRTARIVLGLALDRLTRHYGMIATGPVRGAATHWGDDSYRPSLEKWRSAGGTDRTSHADGMGDTGRR